MSTTDFNPERSAAIRQLLIDTVAEEPRRRKHLQILLTSVLSGIAIVVAGGTAALALTGVIHLGGADTPPPPAPTPTQTITPTPTPTATPTPTPPPLVQSSPVLPHDVNSLAPSTRWSLDLPGSQDCTGVRAFTLSDARAVYVSGLRPKEYENGGDCGTRPNEDIGVTLVDTSDGHVIWTREWRFTPEKVDYRTTFLVLGTSGRALITYPGAGAGPHDVLDLSTGATVGTFRPDWSISDPVGDVQSVPGASGDVVVVKHDLDAAARTIGPDTVLRANPADLANPVWSVTTGARDSRLDAATPEGTALAAEGWDPATGLTLTTMIALNTGATTTLPGSRITTLSQIMIGAPSPDGGSLTGYTPDGATAWTMPAGPYATVIPAATPAAAALGTPDTGEFFVADTKTITLYDQATGSKRWSVPTSTCVTGNNLPASAMLDIPGDGYVMSSGEHRCELSRSTGAAMDMKVPTQTGDFQTFGLTNVYTYTVDSKHGAAYDLATGRQLWAFSPEGSPSWNFDGGYLVSRMGNHIESIG